MINPTEYVVRLPIFVQPYMQYLEVSYGDAHVASLVVLVSIEPADITEFSFFIYFHFVYISDTTTHSFEFIVMFRFCLLAVFQGESVLSQ